MESEVIEMQKTAMLLPYEFEPIFKSLPLEQAGLLILALYQYEHEEVEPDFSDNEILQFSWKTHIKPKIDEYKEKYKKTCEARREAGSKGGKSNQEKQKQAKQANATFDKQNEQKVANQADIDGDRDIDIDIDKDIKEKYKKEKPVKHKHGQYKNVLLSDDELQKLQTEFPIDWQKRIENVSEYCASHGKTYKDYLATIRNWARRDKQKPVPIRKNDARAGYAKAMQLLGLTEEDE